MILINLIADRQIEILPFWVINGQAFKTSLVRIADDDPMIAKAWHQAAVFPQPRGNEILNAIRAKVTEQIEVDWGMHKNSRASVLKVIRREDDSTVQRKILPFDESFLSLQRKDKPIHLETYVDWQAVFDDLFQDDSATEPAASPDNVPATTTSEDMETLSDSTAEPSSENVTAKQPDGNSIAEQELISVEPTIQATAEQNEGSTVVEKLN